MNLETHSGAVQRLLQAGGPGLVKTMVQLFMNNTPQRTAAALGLARLQERAGQIEDLAARGRGNEVGPLLQDLAESFKPVRELLRRTVDGL